MFFMFLVVLLLSNGWQEYGVRLPYVVELFELAPIDDIEVKGSSKNLDSLNLWSIHLKWVPPNRFGAIASNFVIVYIYIVFSLWVLVLGVQLKEVDV